MLMLIRMITVPMDDSAGCYSTISYTNNVSLLQCTWNGDRFPESIY